MNSDEPFLIERIVSALSYVSMGFVGFIWIILGVITKSKIRSFVQYHIFQSIFLSIAYFLISMALGFLLNLLSLIPFINTLTAQLVFYFNAPLFGNYSVIQIFIYTVIIYLTITSFMGKYSRLPYISDIINHNIGRY